MAFLVTITSFGRLQLEDSASLQKPLVAAAPVAQHEAAGFFTQQQLTSLQQCNKFPSSLLRLHQTLTDQTNCVGAFAKARLDDLQQLAASSQPPRPAPTPEEKKEPAKKAPATSDQELTKGRPRRKRGFQQTGGPRFQQFHPMFRPPPMLQQGMMPFYQFPPGFGNFRQRPPGGRRRN